MWKFLLAVVVVEMILAFVAYAIVRAGAEREPVDLDDMRDAAPMLPRG